jgi:hypothetical protein
MFSHFKHFIGGNIESCHIIQFKGSKANGDEPRSRTSPESAIPKKKNAKNGKAIGLLPYYDFPTLTA